MTSPSAITSNLLNRSLPSLNDVLVADPQLTKLLHFIRNTDPSESTLQTFLIGKAPTPFAIYQLGFDTDTWDWGLRYHPYTNSEDFEFHCRLFSKTNPLVASLIILVDNTRQPVHRIIVQGEGWTENPIEMD